MSSTQWYIGTPSGVVLCVDNVEGRRWSGRLYHGYSREKINVHSVEELVYSLEQVYDYLNFPHATMNSRSFQKDNKQAQRIPEREKIMRDEELLSKHGDMGTFIIRVQHRQNSSWQGRITWMDQDKTMYFRSIWELVKLIDSALDMVSPPEDDRTPSWTDEQ